MPASSTRARTTRPGCSAAPRSSTITRRSRSSSPRRSSRRAPRPQLVRVDYVRAEGAFDLAGASGWRRRAEGAQAGYRRGRLRRRVRRSAGPARCDLHHARPCPCDDGAARLDRGLEGDKLTLWTVEPDDRLERRGRRQDAGHPQGECAPDLALHRRRLRRQAVRACRRAARRPGRPRRRAAGEGGAARAR